MLQPKLRDLSNPTQIENCIAQIQGSKSQIKQKITQYFVEFKRKIISSLDKSQKLFISKVNDACTSSIDTLIKLNNIGLHALEVEKYMYKTTKFVQKINTLDVDKMLKSYFEQIKNYIDQIRKIKILEQVPKILQQKQLMRLDKIIKVEGQPIQKICLLNRKLIQITASSVTLQKNTIQKNFDYILPIVFLYNNKQKHILFTLYNNTIGLYSSKLTLHSYRNYEYKKEQIISVTQIKSYIFITETHKITRINLNNLNQVYSKIFAQQIVVFGKKLYQNYIQVAFITNKILFIDFFSFEPVFTVIAPNRVKLMCTINQYLIISLPSGMKIYKDLQQLQISEYLNNLKIVQIFTFLNQIMIVTNQSHIYCINPQETIQYKRINQGLTKIIKGVAYEGYQLYCLSDNGTRIYVQTL